MESPFLDRCLPACLFSLLTIHLVPSTSMFAGEPERILIPAYVLENEIMWTINGISIVLTCLLVAAVCCQAESIETQNNPVPDGTIQVADGDVDRKDWERIPWFEIDDDFDDFSPVDLDRVQMAHDSENVYIHLQTLEWDTEETWRAGIYLDTDDDNTTGYTGDFLAVGADHFVESAAAYEFTAASQSLWGWNQVADLARDQSTMVDIEVAVSREAIDDPDFFHFLIFANNFCCDFGLPDDIYPNGADNLSGVFFTYELGELEIVGDFDASGALDLPDVDELNRQIAAGLQNKEFDLNDDGVTDVGDLTVWVSDLKNTWFGDANLDGEFSSADLVTIFQAGKFEQAMDAGWQEGDWTGDRRFDSGDLVRAFQDGGFERGPKNAISVPESTGGIVIAICLFGVCFPRRRQRP